MEADQLRARIVELERERDQWIQKAHEALKAAQDWERTYDETAAQLDRLLAASRGVIHAHSKGGTHGS
jgi:uncharacterized coiled-coil DUF342 family protein